MRALSQTLVVAALGISFLPSAFSGDALSDAAAREKERRKGKTGKVYTEEDLKPKEPGRQQEQQQQGLNGNNPGGSGLTVTFNFPLDGSTVYGKVPLNVSVSPAENLDGALFYANDQLLGKAIDTAEWINKAWITDSLPAGRYTIRAEAKDKKGRTGSAKVTVTLSKTVHVDPIMSSCKPSSAVPATGVFGINNPYGEDQRAMTEIKDLGMKWVRRDLSWWST